jgi:phosphate transport system substrate-binding protein
MMMKKIAIIVLASLFLVTCGDEKAEEIAVDNTTASTEMIKIKGSETARKIVTSIDEFYKKSNPNAQIEYSGGGSNLGIMSMMHGEADIIFVSRDLNSEESAYFAEKKFIMDTVAIDGLAIVVNKKNNLKEISRDQLKLVYEGKITKWSELGWDNKPINVYSRESTSGTFSMFKEKVLHNGNTTPNHISMNYNEDIVDNIKNDEMGIGYVGLGYTMGNDLKVLGLTDSINKSAVKPDFSTIVGGDYFLKRFIVAIYDGNNERIKSYVNSIHNEYTYKIINEAGFIPYKKL